MIFWTLVASFSAIFNETAYRAGIDFWRNPIWIIPAFLIQFGLWKVFSQGQSFLGAWVLFFAVNLLLRVLSSRVYLGEPITGKILVALALVTAAAVIVKT